MPKRQSDDHIIAAVREHGSFGAAARALGMDRRNLVRRFKRSATYEDRMEADARRNDIDPGVISAATETGLSLESARPGWRRVPREDGGFDSVFWKNKEAEQESALAWAQIFREALVDAPLSLPVPSPKKTKSDCLTRYPIADVHWGMRSWDVETGENYDIKIASARFADLMGECLEYSVPSDEAIVLSLGDTIHSNDSSNMTPTSGHVLDVDSRPGKIMYESVKAQIAQIEAAKRKHKHVSVIILQGNHDPDLGQAVGISIMMRFEDDPRVSVDWHPRKLWARRFGNSLVSAHHGDKTHPERLVMQLADDYAPIWGKTYWRYMDTGHIHKDTGRDIGGCWWESHRAVSGRDAAASGMGYTGRNTMKAITVNLTEGEKNRHTASVTLPGK